LNRGGGPAVRWSGIGGRRYSTRRMQVGLSGHVLSCSDTAHRIHRLRLAQCYHRILYGTTSYGGPNGAGGGVACCVDEGWRCGVRMFWAADVDGAASSAPGIGAAIAGRGSPGTRLQWPAWARRSRIWVLMARCVRSSDPGGRVRVNFAVQRNLFEIGCSPVHFQSSFHRSTFNVSAIEL
jgi:hypothetical protein